MRFNATCRWRAAATARWPSARDFDVNSYRLGTARALDKGRRCAAVSTGFRARPKQLYRGQTTTSLPALVQGNPD